MKTILSAVSLALATVMPCGADASELMPLQAGTFVLGSQTVSVYYTVSGDSYEVVTTIAPMDGAAGVPIRFVGFLQPGEMALISAGQFGTTTAPDTLELVHKGGGLSAIQVANVAAR
jgi:hypothetical protein